MATEFVARNGLIVISGQIQGLLASGIVLSGSIASGQINNFKLSSGAVLANLLSGSISGLLLGNESVVAGSIPSGTIGQMHLSSGFLISGFTTANSIFSTTLASGQIGQMHLSSGCLASGQANASSVLSGSVGSGQIGQMHLSSGCITSGDMTSGAVYGTSIIGSGAIVSGNIASGIITFNNFGREILNIDAKANNFRIGVVSGVPISSGDLTSRTSIFLNPYNGDTISLYNGADWSVFTTSGTSVSLATSTLASGSVYDVYCYNNAGVPALEFSPAWTNTTTRADVIQFVNGVPLKSGTLTRRVVGTVYARNSGVVDDSYQYRGVWNWDNRVSRAMYWRDTTSNTFNVSGALNNRPWNNSSGSALFWIQGYAGLGCQVSMSTTLRRSAGAATAYARCDGISNAFIDFVGNLTTSATAEYKTATGPIQCIAGLNWYLARIGMSASGQFLGTEIRLLNVLEG